MDDRSIMPVGKYKGKTMEEVPSDYLSWFAEQSWSSKWPAVEKYINDNWVSIEFDLEDERRRTYI